MKKINLIKGLWDDSHEKQKVRGMRRYAVMLLMLLTFGVGQMWANDATNARIYFDNTNTGWSYVQLVGGHNSWSSGTEFSLISGTNNLWTNTFSWGEYTYFMFIEASGAWPGEGNEAWNRKGDLNYSATISDNVGSNTYLYAPTSSAKNTGYDPSGSITSYSSLNYNQTIYKCVSTNGSTPAKSTANIATLSITTKNLSDATTTANNNGSIGSGSNSVTRSAARTATVTMSVSSINSSYVWLGWYDAESGGNQVEASQSYTYQAFAAKTVYARLATKFTVGKKLYLKPNSDWKSDDARFAACFGAASGQTWVDFTQVGTSDYYYVEVPSGSWGYVIFCRMDGSTATNNWDNKWNQTDDMLASDTKNGAEITGWNNSQNWINVYDGLSVARNINAAANAPTITNNQTATKATTSITVNAQTANTGYDWVNWTSSGSGTFGTATNRSTTFTPAASNEVATANYAEKTYSLTFSHNGHGSIAVGGNTIASGSTASVNYHTTKTLVATNNTGYHFTGWTLSGTNTNKVTIANTTSSGASTSIKATATGATVTAGFEANTYTITLDDDGDYGGNGSATATYNESTLSISSNPTRDDYRINGFYAPGTGDLIADASGNLQASKNANTGSGNFAVTDANGKWIYDGNLTLYAHWTYDVTEYEVNFGVESGSSSFGSLTAYDNNTSSYISTGSDVRSGHGLTFTASPNTGYEVEGWYTDAACTSGKHDEGETTYSIASLSGAADVYVKFKEIEWSVAFAAGTGGSVTTPNSTPQTVGQVTGISIAATPSTGYTFNTWTISSGSGSFTSAATTNSNTFKPTAASTVTASFTETKHTITINGGTAASTTAGVSTTGSATAAAPAAGKKFTGWTLGDGVTLSGGALTDRTINFTATQASSVTANYADRAKVKLYFAKPSGWSTVYAHAWGGSDPSTSWPGVAITGTTETINHVVYNVFLYYTEADGIGNAATGSSGWTSVVFSDNGADGKKTGDLTISNGHYYVKSSTGTGKAAALTSAWCIKGDWNSWNEDTDQITHSSATAGSKSITLTTGNNEFKVYNIVNETWWRFDGNVSATKSATAMNNNDGNMTLTPSVAGPYTFALGSLNGTPTLAITYPVSYTLTYSIGSIVGTSGSISSSPTTSSGSKVISGSTVTLTAPSEKTGYAWKGWYGAADGSGDQLCSTKAYAITMNANKTVYACYTENQYNETVAVSPAGYGTTTPSAGTVAIKQATGTSITANPGNDYAFVNWTYTGGGITASDATNKTCTFKATSTGGTITANFTNRFYLKGSAEMGAWSTENEMPITATANTYSVTLSLAAKTTYDFKVFNRHTGAAIGASSTTLTRGTNSKTGLTTEGGDTYNIHVTTDAAGDYTIKYLYNASEGSMKITVDYPEAYTVTFGAGTINGSDAAITASASPSFSSGDYVLPETDITFSKGSTKSGYTWKGWYSNVGGTGEAWSETDGSLSLTETRDGNISVYACYNFITYNIRYHLNGGSGASDGTYNVETSTITLPGALVVSRTGYIFNGWYDNSGLTGEPVTTITKGSTGNKEFWAKWTAKEYTITLNQNGATTSSDPTSLTATYDAKANGASDVFTLTNPERTGYTFRGWNTAADTSGVIIVTWAKYYEWSTSYVDGTGHWIHDGDVNVYAMWKSNEYTVTFDYDETGYGSAGEGVKSSVTATYGKAMPTMGTAPTPAPGYKFMGYFLGQNGIGAQYYDASGASVINWNRAEATTLYAYFRKTEISSLEHPAAVAKGDVVTVDVNPVFNQTGATDYMNICWSLLYDNDNPVESGWTVAAYAEEGKPNQVRFTLEGLSSGYYKIQAVLKANASSFVACDAGTELSTLKSDLRIAGNSTITIQYEDASGNTISAATSVEVARGDSIGVNAPSIVGYTFSEWVLGDVLSSVCRDAATCGLNKDSINIKAEYDGVLIAQYARKNTIYFKNTLNWPAVYVNLLSSGFWNSNGSGNKDHANRNLAMTQLGETDIWYYEYGNTSTTDYVSFTSQSQSNAANFWGEDTEVEDEKVKVVYPTRPNYDENERTAYGFNINTPMFVPLAGQTAKEMNVSGDGRAYYYNQGYWAKYEPISKETGYKLVIFNKKDNAASPDPGNAPVEVKSVPFTFSGDMTFPVSVTVDLEAGKWYGFKIYRDKGNSNDALSWYGNGGNMSNKHSGDFDKGETVWEFKTTLTANCGLKTNSAGNYVFTLAYGKEAYRDSMQYLVGVHYPEAGGDYRLMYTDENHSYMDEEVKKYHWRPSTTIQFASEADTLSFFVDKTASPKLALQKCEVSYDGSETTTLTWTDTIADLFSSGLPSAITKSGVYYFCINKDPETGKKVFGDTKLYEGNFYIRTDGATPSKWDNFRQNNHLMAYSDYADAHENFTHSYTQWYDLTNRKNLKFTVANDYSVSISDTLVREALEGQWEHINDYIDEKGDLNRQANVRFMYNSKTNAISRAYIDGAYADGGNFLKILTRQQDSIYAAEAGGEPVTEITFTDDGNWLYEKTVYAQPGARYKLRSLYGDPAGNQITQYFKGGAGTTAADSATMIGGIGSSRMKIRLLYDFKTNRVVTAYQPSGTIDANLEINADIMFMREHQADVEQITFASGKSISKIENIYCGLRFNKWTLNNKSKEGLHPTLPSLLSRYERDIFYVSFPYDVRLSDVIGFGTYGQHWIVEYYDGADRAEKGFWKDTETFWKFVTPAMKDTFTMKAGTGYIVALDLDELYYIDATHHASIWDNTDIQNLELLFPGKVSSISEIDVTYNVPEHTCTINRGTNAGNRTIKDSHWNVLGVPTFKNIVGADSEGGGGSGEIVFTNTAWIKDSLKLKFIYDGNLADNSLSAKAVKDFEFKAMHGYVVQYCGDVTFTTSATPAPSPIVARRTYAEKPIDVDFRLELNKNGVMEDQTFISLSNDEDASAGFKFGEDLSKEFNSNRANIYTFIGTEWAAGNTLPMSEQTTVIPVGVKTAAEGEYTFSIPEGTEGIGVVLIDNITGARTNLGLMDYTVTLGKGQIDNRFVLEISPIQHTPTGIESTEHRTQNTDVHKVLIDGILYIVKEGKVFDARGSRVQ